MLEHALVYASRGWPVFPCEPRGKRPLTERGFHDATADPEVVAGHWHSRPDANIGVATGERSGLFVLDVDDKPWRSLDEALASLGGELPDTPTVRTGGGGVQYYFRFPTGSGLTISGGRLGDGIDTRGEGGYVIAPPSVHASGRAYEWWEFEEEPLADVPSWLVERLLHQRSKARMSADERILPGGRHDALVTAGALMRSSGFVADEIEAALSRLTARMDLSDGRVISEREIRDVAEWCGARDMGQINIHSVAHGGRVADDLMRTQGEAVQELRDRGGVPDPGPFPEHLLRVPGLIGALCEHIDATAFKRQPVLSLAASVAAMGALVGRKVQTPYGGRSNLYCLGVAEAGAGKDRARQAIKRVFVEAGADALIGPEDLASETGMLSALEVQPSLLFLLDEVGRLLRVMQDQRAGAHLQGIVTSLLKLYSSAGSVYKGKAYADARRNPVIDQPCACLYGTTIPENLWGSMAAESIHDGLLARMLVFVTNDHDPPKQMPLLEDHPRAAIEAVREWCSYQPSGGDLSGQHPRPAVIERTPEAQEILDELDRVSRAERQALGQSPLRVLWTRLEQKADQLALIFACSRSPEPIIDAAAQRWAADVAIYTTRRLVWECARHVAENATESAQKRLYRIIDDAGPDGIAQRDLLRRCRWLRKREREEFLAALLDGGDVVLVQRQSTGGRRPMVYLSARFGADPDFRPNDTGTEAGYANA